MLCGGEGAQTSGARNPAGRRGNSPQGSGGRGRTPGQRIPFFRISYMKAKKGGRVGERRRN